jgi:predicted DNA-binding protein (MmcQ/YjbR family)
MARGGLTPAQELRAHALALPEAWEDHPWGESVAKVGKKVFAFFGMPDDAVTPHFTVKLRDSLEEALMMPWVAPAGYNLDRGGWVTVDAPEDAPMEMLIAWVEESYRAVAPRRLVTELEGAAKS